MRQLTKKQKKILDKWASEHDDQVHISFSVDTATDFDDVWEELQRINDTEILWMEVNRYISDKI